MDRLGPASTLEPAARLVCLVLLSTASLLARAPFSALVSMAAGFLLLKEGLCMRTILRDSAFVGAFALFAAFIRYCSFSCLSVAAFEDIGFYAVRLLATFLIGRLFYASTSLSELRDAATRITRSIPLLGRFDIGLALSMVLAFIPLIFQEWTGSREAARSRGMPKRAGFLKQAIMISAFLRRLMLTAVAIPEALIARGWTRDRSIAPLRWRTRDSICLVVCGCMCLAATLQIV